MMISSYCLITLDYSTRIHQNSNQLVCMIESIKYDSCDVKCTVFSKKKIVKNCNVNNYRKAHSYEHYPQKVTSHSSNQKRLISEHKYNYEHYPQRIVNCRCTCWRAYTNQPKNVVFQVPLNLKSEWDDSAFPCFLWRKLHSSWDGRSEFYTPNMNGCHNKNFR